MGLQSLTTPTLSSNPMTHGLILIMVGWIPVKVMSTETYISAEFYAKVTEFQKYGIKVTVAIGGWNDSKGDKYSR